MKLRTVGQQLLFNTVCIETKDVHDNDLGSGTSFILAHDDPEHGEELFLVTNKHVVEDAATGYIFFTGLNDQGEPSIGKPFFVKVGMFDLMWHGHPSDEVDIAVMPLSWQLDMIGKSGQKAFYMKIVGAGGVSGSPRDARGIPPNSRSSGRGTNPITSK